MSEIRVALVGVGNCASAFVQGLEYYRKTKSERGLMHSKVGKYRVTDIVPVAAFDVDIRKIGKDLSEAIFAEPNCAVKFAKVPNLNVEVMMGPVMDGVNEHLAQMVKIASREPVDVIAVLKKAKPDVVVNMLPTGAVEAAKFYAAAAFEAGAGFVNGMPALIANDPKFAAMAEKKGVPLIGDDVKSHIGGTAIERYLSQMFLDKGAWIKHSYQLNIGGNSDFFNQLKRPETKLYTKITSMKSMIPYDVPMWGGASGYIDFLKDTKEAYTYFVGEGWAGSPIVINAKLTVSDSPNFASVITEGILCCKLAMDRGVTGILTSASAYLMKCPPEKTSDPEAKKMIDEFIAGKRER